MDYTIKIDKDLKIIIYRVLGEVKTSEMGNGWKKVFGMKEFIESGYNILADYSKSEFNFSLMDTEKLVPILNSSNSKIPNKKFAVIANIPYNTAVSMFIQEMFHASLGYLTKVFSTEKAAMEWLKK